MKKNSKKQSSEQIKKSDAYIEGAGIIEQQNIVDTLKENYMPYAMSVIISRALPEIDGFKPSHRKLLYTMYKMGLLNGARTKSANIVGQTMKLNPHGDQAIYETMQGATAHSCTPMLTARVTSVRLIQEIWLSPPPDIRKRSLSLSVPIFSGISTRIQ